MEHIEMEPGQLFLKEEDIICNAGRTTSKISVTNIGDRPVQIGSHFHFYEVNESLQFNREEGFGKRLNVPSGAAVRFEPGDEKGGELIPYRQARYKQKNVIHMEKGATYLYSDIITPGWSPDGKRFSYDWIQLLNEIYMDQELVAYDHIKLSPTLQNVESIGFMEGFSHLGSMMVIGEQTTPELLDRLYQVIQPITNTYKVGLSQLAVKGFTVRILANSTQVIESIFTNLHHIISQEWFDTTPSFLRKY